MKKYALFEKMTSVPFEEEEEDDNAKWQKNAPEILKVLISSRLPKRQRQVIVLYYYKGMGQREIARKLGITESAVSHAKIEGLKKIKFYMKLARGDKYDDPDI